MTDDGNYNKRPKKGNMAFKTFYFLFYPLKQTTIKINLIVTRLALDLFTCHENRNKGCWYDIITIILLLTTSKYFTYDHIQVVGYPHAP